MIIYEFSTYLFSSATLNSMIKERHWWKARGECINKCQKSILISSVSFWSLLHYEMHVSTYTVANINTDHVTEVETIASATLSCQLHAAGTLKSNCDCEAAACQRADEHTFWIKKGSFRSFKRHTIPFNSQFALINRCGLYMVKTLERMCECSCVPDCTYVCSCAFGPCAMRIFQGFC